MSVGIGEPRPRLGDYILVAKLSEDALGLVYRAIHVRDGRFARLRVLESAELPRAAVLAAIQKRDAPHRAYAFFPPGRREALGIAEGRPFLAWHETNGWTLDAVLTAVRRSGNRVPIEGALRIVAGAAAALEHARSVGGETVQHGLVWPGFVTISRNAEVWVRGYGLAPAVLASIRKPRISRLAAPYVAPEVRERGIAGEKGDIYSLGVLLLELLTGQPPSLDGPPEFAPDDIFSEDVAHLAGAAVAEHSARLSSVAALRERLQGLLEDCPYETSNADLALYLNDLLLPERTRAARPKSPAPRSSFPIVGQRAADEPGASRRVWVLRIAASIAALATLAGIDLTIRRRELPPVLAFAARRVVLRESAPALGVVSPENGVALADTRPSRSIEAGLAIHAPQAVRRPWPATWRQASEFTEVWRLRAALSRVEAQRVDAWNLASEPFRAGRVYEKEGERLRAARSFAAARKAFEQAAQLYLEAEALSHEERARVIRSSTPEQDSIASQSF